MKMRVLAVGCAALPSTILPGNQLLQVRVKSQGVPACSCQKLRRLRDAFRPIPPPQEVSQALALLNSYLCAC